MSKNQFADDGAAPDAPAKLSPNTVVQPGGGGGTVSARAAGMPVSAVTTTLTRHPASSVITVRIESRRLRQERGTVAFIASLICRNLLMCSRSAGREHEQLRHEIPRLDIRLISNRNLTERKRPVKTSGGIGSHAGTTGAPGTGLAGRADAALRWRGGRWPWR